MGESTKNLTVSIDHYETEPLVVAYFEWPATGQFYRDTLSPSYTISPNDFVSFELSKEFPIRPYSISLYDVGAQESAEFLKLYVGDQLTNALLKPRSIGSQIMRLTLSEENRLMLATLQLRNPSTPPGIKSACLGIIQSVVNIPYRRSA